MPTTNARDLGSELIEDHDRGLAFDLRSLLHRPSSVDRPSLDRPSLDRRRALKLFGGAALVAVAAACGSDDSSNAGDSSSSTSARPHVHSGRIFVDVFVGDDEHVRDPDERDPGRDRGTLPR